MFKSNAVLCIYLLLDILGASNSIKCLSLLQGSYFKPFYLSKKDGKDVMKSSTIFVRAQKK